MIKTWAGKVFPAKGQLLGCDLFLREATEPLNVLWENRHFTPMDRKWRSLLAFVLAFVCIAISFTLISLCKSIAVSISDTYDQDDCSSIYTAYNDSLTHYAFEEYYNYRNYTDEYTLTGVL